MYHAPLRKVRVSQTTADPYCYEVRGKSGLRMAGRQVTPGGREPMESATENIPPKRDGPEGFGLKIRRAGKVEMVR
jgi:hypothetical protein